MLGDEHPPQQYVDTNLESVLLFHYLDDFLTHNAPALLGIDVVKTVELADILDHLQPQLKESNGSAFHLLTFMTLQQISQQMSLSMALISSCARFEYPSSTQHVGLVSELNVGFRCGDKVVAHALVNTTIPVDDSGTRGHAQSLLHPGKPLGCFCLQKKQADASAAKQVEQGEQRSCEEEEMIKIKFEQRKRGK